MGLAKSLGSVGGLTLASRVLALGRDTLQAAFMGAGFASDAFLVAFRLPNMFRALFAEGAFSAAFVPMFNRQVAEGGGRPAGLLFAEQALALLFPILLAMTAVMLIAAWPLTWVLSGGFDDPSPAQFAYAVELSRITIPYLMLISLTSLLGGILNSIDRYGANAAAPILLNLSMVSALVFFHGADPFETARVQALAVTAGGVLQLGWLIWVCRASGVSLRLRLPTITPQMRELGRLILPAAVGAGAVQINLVISTALAGSLLDAGSISHIYYANRLSDLPLGIIGIGLGTILLPTLSRQLSGGDHAEAMATQNRAIELALLLTLPAAVALVVAGEPIVRALFQHGVFGSDDTRATALALGAFSLGLPAYVLIKLLTPAYHARQDTRTPMRYATISIGVNIVGNLALIPTIGHIGPPLATTLAALVNVTLLYRTLRKRGDFEVDAQLRRRLPRLALAALLMGGALFWLDRLVTPWTTGELWVRIVGMAALVAAGCVVYGIASIVTGAFSPTAIRALLARRGRVTKPTED
ncbi:murein biosynthesis integral membrane protein MurJ [Sphingomonas sp. FW199]|uniref:murein biosynthesis integral membrane protein MurJ n=1 Tax=Sphingomonas sp. FW199 TaxID=3400217 RepID=UPI003CF05B39